MRKGEPRIRLGYWLSGEIKMQVANLKKSDKETHQKLNEISKHVLSVKVQ